MPVKTQPEINQRLSVYELSQTSAFSRLSPKQTVWCLTYCQGFLDTGIPDPVAATKAAYDCANEESARTLGYQLLAHPKILIVLNRFFGDTPEQSFLERVEQACCNKKLTVAQVDALKLYGELRGWTGRRKRSKADDEPEADSGEPFDAARTKFVVGQLVTQRDTAGIVHTGRVLATDANGLATKIEEVQ